MSSLREPRVLRGATAGVFAALLDEDVTAPAYAAVDGRVDPRAVDPRLRAEFASALELVREEARTEGYAAGYAQGILRAEIEATEAESVRAEVAADAARHTEAEAQRLLGVLAAAAAECSLREAPGLEALEGAAINAALALAEALLGREVAAGSGATADLLSAAMNLAGEGRVVLRVAPSEAAAVSALLGGHPRSPEVRPDATVAPGGGVVDCGAASIDARVDAALERVRHALQYPSSLLSIPGQRREAAAEAVA